MMKNVLVVFLLILGWQQVFAQQTSIDISSIQSAFHAYVALRDAVAVNDKSAIKQAVVKLKDCHVADFRSLRCLDDSVSILNGHLVFDEAFADSLVEGKMSVYDSVDEMLRSAVVRGQMSNGSILTKTCFVKVGKSTKYTFASKGHQELAVVAEAGGLVTMKIRVTNRDGLDKRYDDTRSVKKGLPHRKVSFDLPLDKRNTVELEVINCGKRDISFVVISN